ncbi:MAG: hypothetical protein QOG71_341 [Pyrinomonadaceae bacterium]|nr:hypothetical protein [Pyrinomonadaceae bacterium]
MSHAIVIKCPPPANNCFIVMPFASEYDSLYACIVQALVTHKLHPHRLDITQPGVNFVEDIVKATRSARLVVAVCSPEPATGKPNPNVMYELGMAHALGKPTIILTTDINNLPADLRSHYVLEYNPAGMGSGEFINNIKSKIDDLFFRLATENANLLTDPVYHDILVVPQKKLMLLDNEFWRNFITILKFVKHIRAEILSIRTTHIANLHKAVNDIMENPSVWNSIKSFNEAWENYHSSYQENMKSRVFDPLPRSGQRVEESFNVLCQLIEQDSQEPVIKAREFYKIINTLLQEYLGAHESITNCLVGDAFPLLRNKDAEQTVYNQVNNLYANTRKIIVQTDTLIVNLIEMIQKIGD